jgi:flavin-binding protein dodecin
MAVVKVIELVGTSENSWDDAAQLAIEEAAESLRNITNVEVVNQTARVEGAKITEYRTTLRVAYVVEHHSHLIGAGAQSK